MPPTNKTTNNTKTASSIAPSWQSLYRTHPIKRRRLAANIPVPNLFISHPLPSARGLRGSTNVLLRCALHTVANLHLHYGI